VWPPARLRAELVLRYGSSLCRPRNPDHVDPTDNLRQRDLSDQGYAVADGAAHLAAPAGTRESNDVGTAPTCCNSPWAGKNVSHTTSGWAGGVMVRHLVQSGPDNLNESRVHSISASPHSRKGRLHVRFRRLLEACRGPREVFAGRPQHVVPDVHGRRGGHLKIAAAPLDSIVCCGRSGIPSTKDTNNSLNGWVESIIQKSFPSKTSTGHYPDEDGERTPSQSSG
jgi:hypothetical protein